MDGRSMITTYLSQALNENSTVLPLIESASVKIQSEGGASVSVKMLSDGLPQTEPFRVTNRPVDTFGVDGVNTPLDPTSAAGPTRVARFYDFRAKIGKFVYFIMEANIEIKVNTEKKYFIAGKDSASWLSNQQYKASAMRTPYRNPLKSTSGTGGNNPYNFNTQFPFIGVSGIEVSGGGKAAVELTQASEDTNYDFNDYLSSEARWESLNVDLSTDGGPDGNNYELTWQLPGEVRTAADQSGIDDAGFLIEIWTPDSGNPQTGTWKSLFYDATLQQDVLDLSQSVVNSSNFQIGTGVMTSDFKFTCWVK
jgi:hypothetical protein